MNFEEQFPELKVLDNDLQIQHDKFGGREIDEKQLIKHCLSKQRVKEALLEFKALGKPNKNSICYSEEIRLQIFNKRLGLE